MTESWLPRVSRDTVLCNLLIVHINDLEVQWKGCNFEDGMTQKLDVVNVDRWVETVKCNLIQKCVRQCI